MAKGQKRRGRPGKEHSVISGSNLISGAILGIRNGVSNPQEFEFMSADDLLTKKGFKVYREMTADDQIKVALWFKKTLISARPWDIDPYGKSDEDKKIAEFVTAAFNRLNIGRIVKDACSAFDFGYSAGEILWEVVEEEALGEGLKVVLKDIKFRDPEFITILVDKHGNIERFVQKPQSVNLAEISLNPEKVFHYAYQYQFQNPYGMSDLRAAYRAWWSKKYVTQFWNVFLERFGSPLMMMKYPTGASSKLKEAIKSILQSLSSKSEIMVPESVKVELIEATRGGQAKYDEALSNFDMSIARAILVPALLGMGGGDVKRGSDSQSRIHLRTLMKVIKQIGDEIAEQINCQLITQMVDFNFETNNYPKFTWKDYGEFESFEISEAIRESFNSGILDLDQEDVNYVRGILGLNLRSEGDEDDVLRSQPPPLGASPNDPNATGDGADQENDRAQKSPIQKVKAEYLQPPNITVTPIINLPDQKAFSKSREVIRDDNGKIKEVVEHIKET